MSGFVGRVSRKLVKNEILKSLRILQFKSDDSTGILLVKNGKNHLIRVVGTVDDLIKKIPAEIDGHLSIAHTRYSTYAHQVIENVYPIVSQNEEVSVIVHGLIDNILTLRRKLVRNGYIFKSKSANEVVANLLEAYSRESNGTGTNLSSLSRACEQFEGNYSLIAVFNNEPDRIYYSKRGNPLIIAKNGNSMIISDEFNSIIDDSKLYFYPQDEEIGYITNSDNYLFDKELKSLEFIYTENALSEKALDLGGYPHFMLKEIEEAPRVIRRLINHYFDGSKYFFSEQLINRIKDADNIVFIAAGTSYNAALVGQRYLRTYNKKVDVFIASEWIYYPYQSGENPLYVLISQSGETDDILDALDVIRTYGGDVLAITNTEVSTLYRQADYRLLLYAGPEISVASTKAYIAQITLLSLIQACLLNKVTTIAALERVINALNSIITAKEDIKKIAEQIAHRSDVFFLGRGFDYDLALEAQLKLKETTYIHAEAYPAGEFLHGPIAVVEKETPVIAFISDPAIVSPMRSVTEEIRERSNKVFVISLKPFIDKGDSFYISGDIKSYHSPIVFAVFSQYLAYYVAVILGRDVDRPRSLEKRVKKRNV